MTLRDAEPADIALLLRLIRALAEYERLLDEAVADAAMLQASLFGTPARAHALIAEQDGAAVGFALWFTSFSTFSGRPGLYVEDVFIEPAYRGNGIGRAIFAHLAARALREGCARMEWSVLDWNEPAIRFYRGLGAQAMDGWTVQRLAGDALAKLAASA